MSKQNQGFELWDLMAAEWHGRPGRMIQQGDSDYWAHVPADPRSNIIVNRIDEWEEGLKCGFLTFSNEHTGYKRVVVKEVYDLKEGDIFKCQHGDYVISFLRPADKLESVNCIRRGLVMGLGWVLRKEGEEA